MPVGRKRYISRICRQHGTLIEKLPAWLLEKPSKRIKFYLETGE